MYDFDGEFLFLFGERQIGVPFGPFVFIPRGTLHAARVVGIEPGKMLAVNQIEVHPFLTNEVWSPITQNRVLEDPTFTQVAEKVVLRWHIQRGDIVFPKTVTRGCVAHHT